MKPLKFLVKNFGSLPTSPGFSRWPWEEKKQTRGEHLENCTVFYCTVNRTLPGASLVYLFVNDTSSLTPTTES
jgi:hypothetical protein